MFAAAEKVTSWPLVPLQNAGIPRERLEDCQARSHAAFAWRALGELRRAWSEILPSGRVEMVLLDAAHKRAFVMARAVIETVPFPWHPTKTSWYFYWPTRFEPVVVQEHDPMMAVAGDRISVSAEWVKTITGLAVKAGPPFAQGMVRCVAR